MKKFFAIAILAATAALSTSPASAQMSALKSVETAATSGEATIVHKTGRRGRFAAGLAIGIIGAAIATHHYKRHHYSGHRHRSRRRYYSGGRRYSNRRSYSNRRHYSDRRFYSHRRNYNRRYRSNSWGE